MRYALKKKRAHSLYAGKTLTLSKTISSQIRDHPFKNKTFIIYNDITIPKLLAKPKIMFHYLFGY